MKRKVPKKLTKAKTGKKKVKRKVYSLSVKNKLESKFEKILISFGLVEDVDYIFQYQVETAYFDFFIIKKRILIEVDGDYWHCNPDSEYKVAKYSTQKANVKNDLRKNEIAKKNKLKLLRFWESDIKGKINEVKEVLKKEILL